MRVRRLVAAGALVLAALGGTRSDAATGWKVFSSATAQSYNSRIVNIPIEIKFSSTTRRPRALRIVVTGTGRTEFGWTLGCMNGRVQKAVNGTVIRVLDRSRPLVVTLTDKLGGVENYDVCRIWSSTAAGRKVNARYTVKYQVQ